jgi:hypothetical protein
LVCLEPPEGSPLSPGYDYPPTTVDTQSPLSPGYGYPPTTVDSKAHFPRGTLSPDYGRLLSGVHLSPGYDYPPSPRQFSCISPTTETALPTTILRDERITKSCARLRAATVEALHLNPLADEATRGSSPQARQAPRGSKAGGCEWFFVTLRQTCPWQKPRAQYAFKDSMIRGILQFTLRIAFRCVLHRCKSRGIHC